MVPQTQNRKLAAILYADIVGYTSMMQRDEKDALQRIQHYQAVVEQSVSQHNGEVVKSYGDGSLMVFSSSLNAMQCAVEMQRTFREAPKIPLRIGLHIGEIIYEKGDIFGDGVNIASRLESLGTAGSIMFSQNVYQKIRNHQEFYVEPLGRFEFKNVEEPMKVYAIANPGFAIPDRNEMQGKIKEPAPTSKSKNLLYAAGALVLILLAGLAYSNFSGNASQDATANAKYSIAVLPFENSSNNPELDYYNEGMRAEILNQLIRVPGLDVFSRSIIDEYKNSGKSPLEIGKEVDVEYVLVGSTRQNNIRRRVIDTKLIHVPSGKYRWGEEFNEAIVEISTIKGIIAQNVSEVVGINISPTENKQLNKVPTKNAEAYELYLQAAQFLSHGPEIVKKAIPLLERAIELDPGFARAHTGLSNAYWELAHFDTAPPLPNWMKAKSYSKKAIDLDSTDHMAWNNQAIIQHNFDWDFTAAEKSFQKALSLNPKDRYNYIWFLLKAGKTQKAIQEAQIAMELSPELALSYGPLLMHSYSFDGQYDKALQRAEIYLHQGNETIMTNLFLCNLFISMEQYDKAIPYATKLKKLYGEEGNAIVDATLGYLYAKQGETGKARDILKKLEARDKEGYISPFWFAHVYFGLGETDKAYQKLYDSYNVHDYYTTHLLWDSKIFKEMDVKDPRMQDLLQKVGLAPLLN